MTRGRRCPRSSRCPARRRRSGAAGSPPSSAAGATRCHSGRRCRRPARAAQPPPARAARRGTCGDAGAATPTAAPGARTGARSSRRRPPGCSARAPSRSRGRIARSARRAVAVLEVELVLAALLDGHRELVATRLRRLRDVGAVLVVDQHARELLRRPRGHRLRNPSQISRFAPGTFATSPTIFSNDPRWSNART